MAYQNLDEKIEEIYNLYKSELSSSKNFRKFIRIPLTEQSSLRKLSEDELRTIFHYFRSEERNECREGKSVEEHVVSINTIISILSDQYQSTPDNFTKEFIKDVLEKCLWVVFITDDENKRLNQLGLKNKMPDGWSWRTDNPFIRYQMANIKVSGLIN